MASGISAAISWASSIGATSSPSLVRMSVGVRSAPSTAVIATIPVGNSGDDLTSITIDPTGTQAYMTDFNPTGPQNATVYVTSAQNAG